VNEGSPPATRRLRLPARYVVTTLLFIVAVSAVVYLRAFAPVPARVHEVKRGEIREQVYGRGSIESEREAQLGFDLVGRLSDVLVEEGARVSLGQELARLSLEQVQADLRVATTGVAAARSSLARLSAEERRARATLGAAEREEADARELLSRGSISTNQLDLAQDQLRLARAELDRVLAQRAEATRSIEVAQGGATQRAVTVLRATLLAPFEGLISRRLREPGDTVAVGTTVLRLVDTDNVYVSAWIDETALHRVREGNPAIIELPSGERVSGVVSRVGWEADRQTHELLVDVKPNAPIGRVAIGQRADVWITTQTKPDVVRLPLPLVQRDAQGAYCYVDRGGRIAIERVQLGTPAPDASEITEGLRAGDTVLSPRDVAGVLPAGRRWKRL
jgi:HlyD family secretion protein